MYNQYYQNPYYQQPHVGQPQFNQPQFVQPQVGQQQIPLQQSSPLPRFEVSYIENILRLNKGKLATVYMNFENSQWGSKVFRGTIEAAGKDHIILKDQQSEMRYLLLTIYLAYITFDEEMNYSYPFMGSSIFAPQKVVTPMQNTTNQNTNT